METNHEQESSGKDELREAQKERRVNLAKTVGWATVPALTTAGIGGLGALLTYPIENHYLKYVLSGVIGLGLGIAAGVSGMVSDYIEKFRDFVRDVRDSTEKIEFLREYQRTKQNTQEEFKL